MAAMLEVEPTIFHTSVLLLLLQGDAGQLGGFKHVRASGAPFNMASGAQTSRETADWFLLPFTLLVWSLSVCGATKVC